MCDHLRISFAAQSAPIPCPFSSGIPARPVPQYMLASLPLHRMETMTLHRCAFALAVLTCLAPATAHASPFKTWADLRQPPDGKLPMSGLTPSKLIPNLCAVHYRITTGSEKCQAFFDQGLGYFYSYVWMEAARSFETACRHDPDCALAWWGLSRALERYNRPSTDALKKAHALMDKASHREQLLIQARL